MEAELRKRGCDPKRPLHKTAAVLRETSTEELLGVLDRIPAELLYLIAERKPSVEFLISFYRRSPKRIGELLRSVDSLDPSLLIPLLCSDSFELLSDALLTVDHFLSTHNVLPLLDTLLSVKGSVLIKSELARMLTERLSTMRQDVLEPFLTLPGLQAVMDLIRRRATLHHGMHLFLVRERVFLVLDEILQ